ncbi:MAG TPA: choice-of-anchor D domain-containing protein [Candidatus Cloacimonadota bacterium]|nr:choice-of-anchor D domain-containing protein [Candidatus Cloacimonadota bacterium]
MKYKLILLLWLSATISFLCADNVMQVSSQNASAFQTISVSLNIQNSDSFSAFQTDIVMAQGISYVANSVLLSNRSNGHVLSASLLQNNVLRIFAYSLNNALFSGNSGAVLSFQIQTNGQPGSYALSLQNSIIANVNSVNILNQAISGEVLVIAPNINSNSMSLDFNEIPLLANQEMELIIFNTGNSQLDISNIQFNSPYFEITGASSFSIPANSQRSIMVRFNSMVKGTYHQVMNIISNDPDQQIFNIDLQAIAFAVNELYIQPTTGISGAVFSIPFSIENMESFSAFQFDFQLSENLQFDLINIELTERSNGHTASVQRVNDHIVRVLAYSFNNLVFTGNSGIIAHINIKITGLGGYYNLSPENVIISDHQGINILSESYGNYLNIAAPSISVNNHLDFGDISITETAEEILHIYNQGNADLVISSVMNSNPSFGIMTPMPVTIPAGNYGEISVSFHNVNTGSYQSVLRLFNNDPNNPIFQVTLNGNTFSPNYLSVIEVNASPGEIVHISINADNYNSFVAFQFDLDFPETLTYIQNSAVLSERAVDHVLMTNENNHSLRFISYSPTQSYYSGNDGEILSFDFLINENASGNQYLNLNNGILADANSQNILRDIFNAQIILNKTPHIIQNIEQITFMEDTIDSELNLNEVFYDQDIPNGDILTFTSTSHENLDIMIDAGYVTIVPAQDWFGTHTVNFTATDMSQASCSINVVVTEFPACI